MSERPSDRKRIAEDLDVIEALAARYQQVAFWHSGREGVYGPETGLQLGTH